MSQLPTWRAEVVGSLLRPLDLVGARKRLESGEMTQAEFKAVEDGAVRSAIEPSSTPVCARGTGSAGAIPRS
jgi:5-methyltetrahydropteroyltriglutamate--homocysteine methyltransferase